MTKKLLAPISGANTTLAALAVACLALAFSHPSLAQSSAVQRGEAAAGSNSSANAPLPVMPMGIIWETLASASGTTGTGEQTIATWTMPAGTLDVTGRRLRITATFGHAANTHTCAPKLYFGSESIAPGSDAVSGGADRAVLDVEKTGASTQQVDGWGILSAATLAVVATSATGAETDTAGIVIKATQTGGTTGADCSVTGLVVQELN